MNNDIAILKQIAKLEKMFAEKADVSIDDLDNKICLNDNELTLSWSKKGYKPTNILRRTKMSNWISVKDRLPEEIDDLFKIFLVARNKETVCVLPCRWDGSKFKSVEFGRTTEFLRPTHWQPLPEPPTQ